ncbi:MAG: DUF2029 domain-containing protein [Phycisphaerales bacterium]|nr:DUF2029 domain-containing protein [Phycisphaerales bacterium]
MTVTTLILRNRYARAVAWLVVGATFVSGVLGGYHRGTNNQPDWRDFTKESRHVWQHLNIPPSTTMFGYLPTTFFCLWPFTQWTPPTFGLIAFIGFNVFAALASCYILSRWWFVGGGIDKALFIWPMFLFIAHIQHVLQANQLTLWVLLLCVAGLTLLKHKHDWLGGLTLGLGVCVKVTPAVFLIYLGLRRQWRAVAGMLLAVVAFDVLPSVIVFGFDGAVREHRMWLKRADWYSNRRLIEDPYLRIRRHGNNCAYSLVLARWLRPSQNADYQMILHGDPPPETIKKTETELQENEYLVLDPKPTPGTDWSRSRSEIPDVPRFRLANLSAQTVRLIWMLTLAIPIGALCLATHRQRRVAPGENGWTAEAALWMLLMFWPTPMMRDYYLALSLPAYIVVWRTVILAAEQTGKLRRAGAGIAAIAFFYVSVLAIGWDDAVFYGLHLATLAGLAGACVWSWRFKNILENPIHPSEPHP